MTALLTVIISFIGDLNLIQVYHLENADLFVLMPILEIRIQENVKNVINIVRNAKGLM